MYVWHRTLVLPFNRCVADLLLKKATLAPTAFVSRFPSLLGREDELPCSIVRIAAAGGGARTSSSSGRRQLPDPFPNRSHLRSRSQGRSPRCSEIQCDGCASEGGEVFG